MINVKLELQLHNNKDAIEFMRMEARLSQVVERELARLRETIDATGSLEMEELDNKNPDKVLWSVNRGL